MCNRAGVAKDAQRALILVADDDGAIRGFVSTVLRSRGFAVIEACDGNEALAWASNYDGRVDLLLTDCAMPRLDGIALSEQVTLLHPETRVLFMTGYYVELAATPEQVLRKPFSVRELVQRVTSLLGTVPPSAAIAP